MYSLLKFLIWIGEECSKEDSRGVYPLFQIGIVWDGSNFGFEPKLEEFRDAAVSQVEKMMVLTSDVTDISAKVSPLHKD